MVYTWKLYNTVHQLYLNFFFNYLFLSLHQVLAAAPGLL